MAASVADDTSRDECSVCDDLQVQVVQEDFDAKLVDLQRASSRGCTSCTLLQNVLISFWAGRFQRGLNTGARVYQRDGRLLVGVDEHNREDVSGLYQLLEVTVSESE